MSEEETNEVELLKKWIGLKDTGLYYITFRIEEVEILLNLIDKLQKVIDLMATELSRRPLMIYLDDERDDRLAILDNPKEIIKYYTKKAEEEK